MNTQQLIKLNNEKRELLSEENEAYYSDILIYVRLQLNLSEHSSEEVLIEILDHLLEAQNVGKTATDVFGNKPIEYARTIINELPKENKRNIFLFFLRVVASMLGPILIIRGMLLGISSMFTTIDETLHLMTLAIIGAYIIIYVIAVIAFIIKRIRYSLTHDSSSFKDSLLVGIFAALGMGILMMITYFLPTWGPAVQFPWTLSLISGAVIWLIVYFTKKRRKAHN